MRFFYDKDKSAEIEQRLIDRWDERQRQTTRGDEFHVYDVVYCSMKAYNRMTGVEKKFTKKSVGILVFGIIGGQILAECYPEDQREYTTDLQELVFGHVDVFEDFTFPLEGKVSRKRIFKRVDVPPKWVEQLMCYMAMTGSKKGWLVIINVFSVQISAFCLEMTSEDLISQLVVMSAKTNKIQQAVKNKDPFLLEIAVDECSNCGYKKKCVRYTRKRNK